MSECRNGPDQSERAVRLVRFLQERTINFKRVCRELANVAQGGVSGSEVIYCYAYAKIANTLHYIHGLIDLTHNEALRQLQFNKVGLDTAIGHHSRYCGHKVRLSKL